MSDNMMTFLHKNKAVGHRGFTLVELLVVSAIIGVLATMVVPSYRYFVLKTQITRAKAEIRSMEKDISAYTLEKGGLPTALTDLGRGVLLDPWKRPYEYSLVPVRMSATPLNTDFDLYSKGPDGASAVLLSDPTSLDDIVRASDGGYVGTAADF